MLTFQTDVLIIGGGCTALRAAISAKEKVKKVMVVCKNKAGFSGNSLFAAGGITTINSHCESNSHDVLMKDIYKGGRYINSQEMVRVFSKRVSNAINFLKTIDTNFEGKGDKLKPAPGHSLSRTLKCVSQKKHYKTRGFGFLQPLLRQCRHKGVNIINNCMITELLYEDNSIYGAKGIYRTPSGSLPVLIQTKSCILATGGGGGVYRNNNNFPGVIGDSYGLALDIGLELRDMEFVQFNPSVSLKPQIVIDSSVFNYGAVFRDIRGDEIFKYYGQEESNATRDEMCRIIALHFLDNRMEQDYVLLDLSNINQNIIQNNYQQIRNAFLKHNIDITKEPIICKPSAHFFMGGVSIGQDCQTKCDGLFVAGEAAGGLHGANRLPGNALAETQVFGEISGERAADYALGVSKNLCRSKNKEFLLKEGREDVLIKASDDIRNIMDNHCALLKNSDDLSKSLDILESHIKQLTKLKINGYYSMNIFKAYFLARTAQVVLYSSIQREESRGSHYRSDFPEEKRSYIGNYYTSLKNGVISSRWEKAKTCN